MTQSFELWSIGIDSGSRPWLQLRPSATHGESCQCITIVANEGTRRSAHGRCDRKRPLQAERCARSARTCIVVPYCSALKLPVSCDFWQLATTAGCERRHWGSLSLAASLLQREGRGARDGEVEVRCGECARRGHSHNTRQIIGAAVTRMLGQISDNLPAGHLQRSRNTAQRPFSLLHTHTPFWLSQNSHSHHTLTTLSPPSLTTARSSKQLEYQILGTPNIWSCS
jgi:hypothetical protein